MINLDAVGLSGERLRWMIRKEMRGPGDGGSALERLIARYELSSAAVRKILYKKPADIYLSVYLSIQLAHEAEVLRWEKAFEHERAIARAKTGAGAALLCVASALDRVADQVGGSREQDLTDGGAS